MKNKLLLVGILGIFIISASALTITSNSETTFLVNNATNQSVLIFLNFSSQNEIYAEPQLNISNTNGLNYSLQAPLTLNLSTDKLSGNWSYYFNTTNSTEGNYTLVFAVFDKGYFQGTTDNYTTITYIVNVNNTLPIVEDETPPVQPTTTSSGGGGSGGGGGGSSSSSTISKLFAEITPSGISFIPAISESSITELFIATKTTAVNIRIGIENVKDEQIPTTAPHKVYSYLQINSGSLTDDNIATARINFHINNTWLNNHDTDSVVLYRYTNDVWQELVTTKLNTDEQYTYYSAETPGFSYFAITASKLNLGIAESSGTAPIERQTENDVPPITGAATGILFDGGDYLILILAGFVLVIVVGYILIKRRKLKKQNENQI